MDTQFSDMGIYAGLLALFCIFLVVMLILKKQSAKALQIGLTAGLVGIFIGAAGLVAASKMRGYTITPPADANGSGPPGGGGGGGFGGGGGGGGGAPGGGGGGAPGGSRGGGGRGGFQPSPTRELTTLVRELDLLTGDVKITLSAAQAKSVKALLAGIKELPAIEDDAAKDMLDEIMDKLTDEQKAKLEAVSLPRTRGAGGRGGGGGGDEPTNPFVADENAKKAWEGLHGRL